MINLEHVHVRVLPLLDDVEDGKAEAEVIREMSTSA